MGNEEVAFVRVAHLEGDRLVVNTVSVHGKFVVRVRVMVFNATFNNISVVSWLSVLLVGKVANPKKTTDLP